MSKNARAIRAERRINARVENIIHDKFAHMLADVDFRIKQAYDVVGRVNGEGRADGKVYAEDLKLIGRHFITGYTITNNSPSAGYVAWADLHMVYNGTDTTITNGNSNLKYLWWSPTVTPTVLQASNTKPVLAAGEVLLFVNTAGSAKVMLSDTNASLPTTLGDGSVDSGAIIANAVTSTAIATGAVTSAQLGADAVIAGKIADGAVDASTVFASGVVNSTALGANAVTAGKIATGGISASGQFAAGVVNTAAIGADQITNTLIAPNAVNTGELATNAVTSAILADGAVSTAAKLATGVVSDTKLATGAVTPTKLNILRHVLY